MYTIPSKPPVRCVKDQSQAVILAKVWDTRVDDHRWRYRCLDCGSAWWVEEHGGSADEYRPVG